MASKTFNGNFSSLEKICNFVTKEAKEAGLNEDGIYAVQLAVDEACSNIIEHAYRDQDDGEIICECKILDDGLEIVLKDNMQIIEKLSGAKAFGELTYRKDMDALYEEFLPIGEKIIKEL